MDGIKITRAEAIDLCIEIWEEIVERELLDKSDLSPELYERVKEYQAACPLCSLYWENGGDRCPKCPLGSCTRKDDPFWRWLNMTDLLSEEERIQAAKDLLEKIYRAREENK